MSNSTNVTMSLIRIACPLSDGATHACWLCEREGWIEFWLPDEQIFTFRHDPCLVLRTVLSNDFSVMGTAQRDPAAEKTRAERV